MKIPANHELLEWFTLSLEDFVCTIRYNQELASLTRNITMMSKQVAHAELLWDLPTIESCLLMKPHFMKVPTQLNMATCSLHLWKLRFPNTQILREEK